MAVSWLHISDFHIKTGDPYDRNVVLQALVKSVAWYREHDRPVDLIFATGDIAHSGQPAEYEIATQFFDQLLAAAALPKSRLYLIPGNHDVDREVGETLLRTLDSEKRATTYFQPGKAKPHLTLKQAAFLAWHDEYFKGLRLWPRDSTCGPFDSIEIHNQPLAILPINSALFCQDDQDHNKLWIGRRSLQAALEPLAKYDHALKLALIHHPLDWLNYAERPNIEAAIQENFDLVLRGHLHESKVDPPVFAAGAAYQTREYPNRALFGAFDRGWLTIFPIRYEDSPHELWADDVSLYPREPGHQKSFPLRRFVHASAPPPPSALVAPAPTPARPIPSNIPPRFGPFIGRDDDLKQIAERLSAQPALVLHGQPGVGKSGLALEYARVNRAQYPGGTFFLNASSALLPTDLARLGQTYFGLQFEPDLPIPLQAERTLSALGPEPLLLLYDNAESIESIRNFLPPAGVPCHVLITTVFDPWKFELPSLEIKPLSETVSIELIQALGGEEVAQTYGKKLAEAAGGLPMQICPAARMLAHERQKGRLSSAQLTLTAEAQQSFRGVYERLDADSQLLLHAALQFNPQRILRDELAVHLTEGTSWQDAQFTNSLNTCSDLHLLDGAAQFRMHQLFATFLHQSTLPPELDQRLQAIRAVQAQRFMQYARQVGNKPTDAEAVSKFLAFRVDLSSWQKIALTGGEMHSTGYALFQLQRFDEARHWLQCAAELKRTSGVIDHQSLGMSLHVLGVCHAACAHHATAKECLERAAAEKTLGGTDGSVDHESLGLSLQQVGYCLYEMGSLEEAQLLLKNAIAEYEKANGGQVDHTGLGMTRYTMGCCLIRLQQYGVAEHWFKDSIAELERGDLRNRVNHEMLGRSLGGLALCRTQAGYLPEALSIAERAIRESRQGDVHGRVNNADLAISLRNAAYLLRELDRTPEAKAYEREADELDPPKT
jgi:tetratricopeptide (TPR) repeat protein/predicted MPP superfamily phosphohydrolase